MAGIRSVTNKCLVVKKIFGDWVVNEKKIPRRQLIVLQGDNTTTLTCTDDVINSVQEFEQYSFIVDYDIDNKKLRIVGILNDKK